MPPRESMPLYLRVLVVGVACYVTNWQMAQIDRRQEEEEERRRVQGPCDEEAAAANQRNNDAQGLWRLFGRRSE